MKEFIRNKNQISQKFDNMKDITYSRKQAEIILGHDETWMINRLEPLQKNKEGYTFQELQDIAEQSVINFALVTHDYNAIERLMKKQENGKKIYDLKIGKIYFVLTESNRVKIGFSQGVGHRFRTIKSTLSEECTFLGSIFGSIPYENHLHYKYRELIAKGTDWFFYTKKLKQDIQKLIAEDHKYWGAEYLGQYE